MQARFRQRTGSCVTAENMPAHRAPSVKSRARGHPVISRSDVACLQFLAMCSLAALILLCLSLVTNGVAQSPYRQRVLVLGGDGMLGSETVARLKLRGHDITILHRGRWYWDSALRIKPWVNFIQCDRDHFNGCADKLTDITREKGMFDVVMDFSGYKPSHIKVNSRPLLHCTISVC